LLFRSSLALAIAGAITAGLNATLSQLLFTVAFVGLMTAYALTFEPPLSFALAAAALVLAALTWVVELPHWGNVALGLVLAGGCLWVYVVAPVRRHLTRR
jgi:hypothetical protein